MKILRSPILWAIIGSFSLIFGLMTSDEETYPTASKFSGWAIVLGGLITGFSLSNIFKWNPLTPLNLGK